MQDRAMALMGKKLTAAEALEGAFSREGLVAMAGEDANVEIALARSLVERMDEGDARRMWSRVVNADQEVNAMQTGEQDAAGYSWRDALGPGTGPTNPEHQRQLTQGWLF